MKKLTKKAFELYLNETYESNYGTKLRRNDPIQFDIEFQLRARKS